MVLLKFVLLYFIFYHSLIYFYFIYLFLFYFYFLGDGRVGRVVYSTVDRYKISKHINL